MPNNVVYGILSDSKGNLWISTNRGISCFTPATEAFRNFNANDGLPGDEFNRYEYFKMPDGELFFGGIEGGVLFSPDDILETDAAPPIVLTGLSVFNIPVTHQSDIEILPAPIHYAAIITLPPGQNLFPISYAALEYTNPEDKHYRYLLEGYDGNWINAGNKTEAVYSNLSPGKYTFRVTGAGRSGIWNTKGASIEVIILPAWWQTWSFRILSFLCFLAIMYAIFQYRLKQSNKLQHIRNRISSDLHDDIGSTLSSISIMSTILQKKNKGGSEDTERLLFQISDLTDRMMESISDIVWTVNTKNDKFDNIIIRMRTFAIEMLEPKACQVHFNVTEELAKLTLNMDQRKNLYLLFKEAINNAAKYSGCKNVWVDISRPANRKIMLRIKDDGIGFVPRENPRKEGVGSLGGNGIQNMHRRALELKGSLKINSAPGKGTEIILEFMV